MDGGPTAGFNGQLIATAEATFKVISSPIKCRFYEVAIPSASWQNRHGSSADGFTKSIPIIGLSAHAMAGDEAKALTAGCDDYDTKPIEFDRLLGKIEALLGK